MKLMKSPTPILVKTFESSSRMVLLSRNLLLSIQGVYLLIARQVDKIVSIFLPQFHSNLISSINFAGPEFVKLQKPEGKEGTPEWENEKVPRTPECRKKNFG